MDYLTYAMAIPVISKVHVSEMMKDVSETQGFSGTLIKSYTILQKKINRH